MWTTRALIAWGLSVTLFGVSAAEPSGDAACTNAPTRACVFDEAFKIARASPPSVSDVSRVLSAYAAVDPSGALRLAPKAESYRSTLRPFWHYRASVDAALVVVYAKARKFLEAERVLARLKRTASFGGSALALATEIARAQSVTAAIARLRALGLTQVSSRAFFSDVAPLAIARGEDAALLEFARETDRTWAASTEKAAIWAYEHVVAIALAQLEANQAQSAWATASGIPPYAARVSALGQLGAVFVDRGRVDEALAESVKIQNVDERKAVLFAMVRPPSVDLPPPRDPPGRPQRPVRVAAAMQLAAFRAGTGRDYAYALIARACAESGALPHAWNAAQRIKTPFSSYHALKSIGHAEAKSGNTRGSLQTFERARAKARVLRHTPYDLIDLQIALGQLDAAKAAMREEAGKPRNGFEHMSAQTRLMAAYAGAGRVEEAFLTPVDDMSNVRKTTHIARALAAGGFIKKALATLSAARELGDEKTLTLIAVVEDRAYAGALGDAAFVLEAISPERRHSALIAIAEAHARIGNGEKASAYIRDALLLPPQIVQNDGGLAFLLSAGKVLPK